MSASSSMEMTAPGAANAPLVLYFHPDANAWVMRWAGRMRLEPCMEPPEGAPLPLLWAEADHLELRVRRAREKGAWVDERELRRRIRQAPELLRACAIRPGMRALDAMAGWGLDGLVLAAAGARVTLVERLPLLQALQEDLIRRAGMGGVVESLPGDGFALLDDPQGFDVVYLDPMFPARGKQALPGKRMQYLAALIDDGESPVAGAPDRPLDEWIERAIAVARHRVVVKRRLHDAPGLRPDWQIRGRSIRYDVYRGRGVSAPEARPDESPDR
jgi:16S rRNA (guanine1516-N2)-methyltransferase